MRSLEEVFEDALREKFIEILHYYDTAILDIVKKKLTEEYLSDFVDYIMDYDDDFTAMVREVVADALKDQVKIGVEFVRR